MTTKCICKVTKEEGTTDTFIKIDGYYYKSQMIYDKYIKRKSISGIYSITNKVNGVMYIGESMDVHRRWKEHIDSLNNQSHINYLLQNDFNKYGIESFEFKLVQECYSDSTSKTKCRLLILEYKYMKKYEKADKKLYNLEYSLLKILNREKTLFSYNFNSILVEILVGQITKYSFIQIDNEFIITKRKTLLSAFCELTGYKKCKKSNSKYQEFKNILNNTYKDDLSRIIKKYTIKYKINEYNEINIEEVTDYGITIFKKILNDNPDIFSNIIHTRL